MGKSSILNALTQARVKVGEYSFTTIHPQVGIVEYSDFIQISIADLPGLLSDITRGFGTRYLNHLDKCSILIFVLDASSNSPISLFEQYQTVKQLVINYNPTFFNNKKKIILVNKIEELDENSRIETLKACLEDEKIYMVPISAKNRINLSKFLRLLRHVYFS